MCVNFIFTSLHYVPIIILLCSSQFLAEDGDEEEEICFTELTKCNFYSFKQQQHDLCTQNEDVGSDISLQLATSKDDIESSPC